MTEPTSHTVLSLAAILRSIAAEARQEAAHACPRPVTSPAEITAADVIRAFALVDFADRLDERAEQMQGTNAKVSAHPVVYAVNALPDNHDAARDTQITVRYRGDEQWVVAWAGMYLDANGVWEYAPSDRGDDWFARHLFPLDVALRLAANAAPHVTVNGRPAADLAATDPEETRP